MLNNKLKSHFLNLYLIALIDNNFDEKELETIMQIGKEKGIGQDEFEDIIINPTKIDIESPTEFIEKIKFLYDFMRVIWADRKIAEDENISFKKFCEKFGFDIQESEELFHWLLDLAKNNVSTDELDSEILKLID